MTIGDIFFIFALNIDEAVSNEYTQSKFFSQNMKNNIYPYKPHFFSKV